MQVGWEIITCGGQPPRFALLAIIRRAARRSCGEGSYRSCFAATRAASGLPGMRLRGRRGKKFCRKQTFAGHTRHARTVAREPKRAVRRVRADISTMGLPAFGRDWIPRAGLEQHEGLSGDANYRAFYRDIGLTSTIDS